MSRTMAPEVYSRRFRRCLPLLVVTITLAGCAHESEKPPLEPVALVRAVPIRADSLTEILVAYGTVISAPGAEQSLTVPFESTVRQVLVSTGQAVFPGDPLMQLALSPAAKLQVQEAQNALTSERQRLESVRQRFALGLATQEELVQRQQVFDDAQARHGELSAWARQLRLAAPAASVISQVLVSEGELAPAGAALMTLARQDRFEIRIGVEPEDARLVKSGQRVTVHAVGRASEDGHVVGTVRSVARQVSSDTRLVEVLVTPTAGSGELLLGEFVRGEVEVTETQGLIVPRSALLPAQDRYSLFTIHEGRVVRHLVMRGVQTDSLVAVQAPDLAPGDSVVVLGNYVLTDGMRVRTRSAPAGTTMVAGPRGTP
jgi:membrane fusion protein (multidrug efflux system)